MDELIRKLQERRAALMKTAREALAKLIVERYGVAVESPARGASFSP